MHATDTAPSHDANDTPLSTGTASTNPCKYMYKCTIFVFKFRHSRPSCTLPGTTTAACPHATRYQSLLTAASCFAPTGQSFVFLIPALLLVVVVVRRNLTKTRTIVVFGEPDVCIGRTMRVYEAYILCAIEPRILVTCADVLQGVRRSRKAGAEDINHRRPLHKCTSPLMNITCHSLISSSLLDSHMYMYSYDRPRCLPEHSMSILTRNGGLRVGVGVIATGATTSYLVRLPDDSIRMLH